ncbi:hypothetical protein LZ32DRAFT_101714 [Colletotrichum eremochloae]|nr:hypothetical protein LZ32DRAFT_101714 [Colletotrichum eremochloae]
MGRRSGVLLLHTLGRKEEKKKTRFLLAGVCSHSLLSFGRQADGNTSRWKWLLSLYRGFSAWRTRSFLKSSSAADDGEKG